MSDPSPSSPPAQKPSSWKTILIAIVVIALIGGGLWYWRMHKLSDAGGWAGGGPLDVVAMTVESADAPVGLEALGEVRAVRQVTLSTEVAGRVSAIAFEPGQRIEAGTVLVQLDDAPEQADLIAARAAATFAQHQYTRASELAAKDATSREVLQQRQAERDQTAAQVQQLEARIRHKRIRAPFDGELGLRRIDLGQYVNAGDEAVTLTDLDQLYINFDVPQQELARVRVGQPIQVRGDIVGSEPTQATISAIEPQVNRNTRNVTIQAEVDNTERALRPGMYVTVTVVLPAESNALVLPASAVMTSPSGDMVVVVRDLSDQNIGIGDIVPVVVSRRIGDQVVIERGLEAGNLVLTEGQLRVRPGAELRVVNNSAAPAGGGE